MAFMVGRDSDERLLEWLRLSDQGVKIKDIAARWGMKPNAVAEALRCIRRDDRLAHGE